MNFIHVAHDTGEWKALTTSFHKMRGSAWSGAKYKGFSACVQRIQNVLELFANLFIDDDKRLFRFEWSNGTKDTYIKG